METPYNKTKVVEILNKILESELAGIVRYTHYSLMIFGYNRIPIVSWMRGEATTALAHAQQAGEMITALGEHPSLGIGSLLETHQHNIGQILHEAMEHEQAALALYKELLNLVEHKSIFLEEYARKMIAEEEGHAHEVNKMLRNPGDVHAFKHDKG